MADRPILIVADSRGHHLGQHLHRSFVHLDYQLVWRNGLSLAQTPQQIIPIIRSTKPKLVILINGICDLTYIKTREPWTVAMRSPSVTSTVYEYMSRLDYVHSQLYQLSDELGHKLMVIFSTLTGMDMRVYNKYPDELKSPEQPMLDAAITAINRHIKALNRSMQIATPLLASEVHRRCRGRYRLAHAKLWDGCHPNQELCARWADRLYENALINANRYDNYNLTNSMGNYHQY